MAFCRISSSCCQFPMLGTNKIQATMMLGSGVSKFGISVHPKGIKITPSVKVTSASMVKCSDKLSREQLSLSKNVQNKQIKKVGKREHHLWKNSNSSGSGKKALSLVQIVSDLPNEKEAVYKALDKWVAWETEFPLAATAKALQILRKRSQWLRVIQWLSGGKVDVGQRTRHYNGNL